MSRSASKFGARRITLSTVGLAPRIRRLADEPWQVNLAVSLHQTTDAARSALMPVNRHYPIAELLDAVRFYTAKTPPARLVRVRLDVGRQRHRHGR